MLDNLHIAGDLAGLFLAYIRRESLDLPELEAKLSRFDANHRMSYSDWWEALEVLRDTTGKPHIALELGAMMAPAYAGVLGYLSLSCDYLGEALIRFERYQSLLYGGSEAQVSVDGEAMRFTWPLGKGYSTRESDETLLAALVQYTRLLADDDQQNPLRVGFLYDPPADLEPYRAFFRCPIEFNSPNLFVEVDQKQLAMPTSQGDPALKALLDRQAETLLESLPDQDTFLQQLSEVLLRLMQDGSPSLKEAAAQMAMSERSLHRRLEERDTNFKDFLHNTRYKLARQYLMDRRLNLSEIALLLGYSEQSAFSRSFKQWSGVTPRQWQKAHPA